MIDITLDDRELKAALDRLQRRLSDLSPVMRDIGELLAERAKQRFATSTGPDGKAWAPNAPSTLAAYLGRYGDRVDEGVAILRASMRPQRDRCGNVGERGLVLPPEGLQ